MSFFGGVFFGEALASCSYLVFCFETLSVVLYDHYSAIFHSFLSTLDESITRSLWSGLGHRLTIHNGHDPFTIQSRCQRGAMRQ